MNLTIVYDWAIPKFGQEILLDWEIKKAANDLDDLIKNIVHDHKRGVAITMETDT